MNSFFSAIANVLNSPQDPSVRQSAVLQGQSLATTINSMASQTEQLRSSIDSQISGMADSINTLTSQIAQLNVQIAQLTGGGQSASAAVGLTDQRNQAISSLSTIDRRPGQHAAGRVDHHQRRRQQARQRGHGPAGRRNLLRRSRHDDLDAPDRRHQRRPRPGFRASFAGCSRRATPCWADFEDQLNSFAGTLANEFNKVYSGGQGMTGYSQVTGHATPSRRPTHPWTRPAWPSRPPTARSRSSSPTRQTRASTTTNSSGARCWAAGHTTTLNSLAAEINNISGLKAQVADGKLSISATDANTTFAFGTDTSGTLAALGINTFFTGSTRRTTWRVNNTVVQDPTKFAASSGGVGADTNNAQTLANFLTQPLASQNGDSIQIALQHASPRTSPSLRPTPRPPSDAADTVQSTLSAQETAASGVNIDDEVVSMLPVPAGLPGLGPLYLRLEQLDDHADPIVITIAEPAQRTPALPLSVYTDKP